MKRYPGMNVMRGMLLAPALLAAACGGEPRVASKSAAAAGGHDHSAHSTTSTGAAPMDHSAHGTGANAHAGHGTTTPGEAVDHAAMGHGTAANTHAGHGTTTPGEAVDHAAMGHGTAANAHTGHTATTGTATHDRHAGMQHGTTAPAADPHAQHGTAGTAEAPAPASAPRSSADMKPVQPAITLRPDAFDAPSPISVAEAAKAARGGGHEGHQMRGITPGQDRENPPAAATVYTCPMHPEVTSDRPGTCPKCGMALVTKK
ncbi:MAG TPA: heavy metal-binding domain-containing protein [Thermoanaerobaculia bacterium]|nr:heavy metal-binding domain-containing protein [Thermoanaerobaculia bacterium]